MYLVTDRTHTEIFKDGTSSRYTFFGLDGGAADRKEALYLLKNTIPVSVEHVNEVWNTRRQQAQWGF